MCWELNPTSRIAVLGTVCDVKQIAHRTLQIELKPILIIQQGKKAA